MEKIEKIFEKIVLQLSTMKKNCTIVIYNDMKNGLQLTNKMDNGLQLSATKRVNLTNIMLKTIYDGSRVDILWYCHPRILYSSIKQTLDASKLISQSPKHNVGEKRPDKKEYMC